VTKGHKYVEPQRMCCACREMKGKRELLRLVRSPAGELSLDGTGRKAGRGAYLCRNAECLKKARKARSLERALNLNTKIPEEIWQEISAALPAAPEEHGETAAAKNRELSGPGPQSG